MNEKSRQILLDDLNKRLLNCRACALHETRLHVLPGEGNAAARLMLVACSPGRHEDKEAKMFIGPSGKKLNMLLAAAGVERDGLYMTNLVKCILPGNRHPKVKEIESCSHFIKQEIAIVQPHIIIPLGFYASRFILELFHAEVPSARAAYRAVFGQLIYAGNQNIFPVPHPASLLYNPHFEEHVKDLYRKLAVFRHDCHWFPVCPLHKLYNQGRIDKKWIMRYCRGDWQSCRRFKMEKNGEFHPDNMLPDGTIVTDLSK